MDGYVQAEPRRDGTVQDLRLRSAPVRAPVFPDPAFTFDARHSFVGDDPEFTGSFRNEPWMRFAAIEVDEQSRVATFEIRTMESACEATRNRPRTKIVCQM